MIFLAVAVSGALGAICRFWMDSLIRKLKKGYFPWGTLTVNVSGSFALGVVVALAMTHEGAGLLTVAVSTGFLGAYTTFSGWMVQTMELIGAGAWEGAIHNIFASVICGILAAALGFSVTDWVF
ncbi:MAG: fluoride efflux transporter CrcB [Balneolales bacterium]